MYLSLNSNKTPTGGLMVRIGLGRKRGEGDFLKFHYRSILHEESEIDFASGFNH
jgi:hypothetical protein